MDTVSDQAGWVEIPVGRRRTAKVDASDEAELLKFKWHGCPVGGKDIVYASRMVLLPDGRMRRVFLHRHLLQPPDGMVVDHINGDGLDNRRCNLRICTQSQNKQNKRRYKNSPTRYKGITWSKNDRKWIAKISVNNVRHYGGSFKDEVDAAKRYDELAREHFGEFARTNF